MNKHLPKIKIFDPKKLRKLAADHVGLIYQRVTDDGSDAKGRKFPPYSEAYKKLLFKDFKKKDGSRYKGYEKGSLTTGAGKVANRPFMLRGLTMKDLKPITSDNDSYTIGWHNPEAATIVWGNAKRAKKRRDIISDFPDREWKWILRRLGKNVDDEWSKVKNVKIRVG